MTASFRRKARAPSSRTGPGATNVSVAGVVIISTLLALITALATYGLWRFWPAASPATGSAPPTAQFSYFNWDVTLTRDQQFFVIVALAGVMGAMLHGLRSLAKYVGERYFIRSWVASYLLLPFIGAVIATIVYLVLRAGLLPGATSASQPDPYGISAIAALVGLFSAQAAEKMKAVFETLFVKPEAGSESVDSIAKPTLDKFEPTQGPPGSSVTITGSNLSMVSKVLLGGRPATITSRSDDTLVATVPDDAVDGLITLDTGSETLESGEKFTIA